MAATLTRHLAPIRTTALIGFFEPLLRRVKVPFSQGLKKLETHCGETYKDTETTEGRITEPELIALRVLYGDQKWESSV